jgi:hypothetical protein
MDFNNRLCRRGKMLACKQLAKFWVIVQIVKIYMSLVAPNLAKQAQISSNICSCSVIGQAYYQDVAIRINCNNLIAQVYAEGLFLSANDLLVLEKTKCNIQR